MRSAVFLGFMVLSGVTNCEQLFAVAVSADGVVGKITALQQKDTNPIRILKSGGFLGEGPHRAACKECPVYETDTVATGRRQFLNLLMDDGTQLALGEHTRLVLKRWKDRDAGGLLRRSLELQSGTMRAIVKKAYTDDEPFLLKTKESVMAVRGTDFVTTITRERGEGETKFDHETVIHLYTLEGEVHFARSESDLHHGKFAAARAGYHSVLYPEAHQPLVARKFALAELTRALKVSLPQVTALQVETGSYAAKALAVGNILSPKPSAHPTDAALKAEYRRELRDKVVKDDAILTASARAEANKSHRRAQEVAADENNPLSKTRGALPDNRRLPGYAFSGSEGEVSADTNRRRMLDAQPRRQAVPSDIRKLLR